MPCAVPALTSERASAFSIKAHDTRPRPQHDHHNSQRATITTPNHWSLEGRSTRHSTSAGHLHVEFARRKPVLALCTTRSAGQLRTDQHAWGATVRQSMRTHANSAFTCGLKEGHTRTHAHSHAPPHSNQHASASGQSSVSAPAQPASMYQLIHSLTRSQPVTQSLSHSVTHSLSPSHSLHQSFTKL
jgi:hypothetical protein